MLFHNENYCDRRPWKFLTSRDENHFISKTFDKNMWRWLLSSVLKELNRAKERRNYIHSTGVDTTWDYNYHRDRLQGSVEIRKLQRLPMAAWGSDITSVSSTFEVEVIKWSIPSISHIRDEEQLIHEITLEFKEFEVMMSDVDFSGDHIGCVRAYYTFKKQNNYERPDHMHLHDVVQGNSIVEFFEYQLWWNHDSIYGSTIMRHRLDQYIKNVMDQENIFNSAVDLMCFIDEMRHLED